ncbi:hypothetical protein BTO05_12725 [Winogradskyella sp. PC-19]|nr:hypothetical protein BTO05_12725 [Winogradskyella sp. PC-19]
MALLMLITSVNLNAQDFRKISSKSIPATKDMSVIFNLKNTTVRIEESTDGKIHYNYSMEFTGYTKKQIAETLKKVTIKTAHSKNHMTLEVDSDKVIQLLNYSVDDVDELMFRPKKSSYFNKSSSDTIVRVSKDSMLQAVRRNRNSNPKQFLQQFTFFKGNDRNNMFNEVSSKRVDIMKSKFVIKIPPFIKLNINADNSNIYFNGEIQNELSINQTKGKLKVEELRNAYNNIILNNVLSFEAQNIVGGNYKLKSLYHSNIVAISSVKVESEFSKIKFGEIGRATTITDFNSEYWFYNWSNDFERFNLYSEYSKIHLFYPKANHSLSAIGNNTKMLLGNGDFEVEMQPTRNGEKFTMMTKGAKDETKPVNEIYFDIVHGIIFTHEDSIKQINKD